VCQPEINEYDDDDDDVMVAMVVVWALTVAGGANGPLGADGCSPVTMKPVEVQRTPPGASPNDDPVPEVACRARTPAH